MVGVYGLEAKRSLRDKIQAASPPASLDTSNSAGSRALGDLSQGPADRQIGTVIPKITMSLVIAALIYYKSTGSLYRSALWEIPFSSFTVPRIFIAATERRRGIKFVIAPATF
jgi:hypothetical protein